MHSSGIDCLSYRFVIFNKGLFWIFNLQHMDTMHFYDIAYPNLRYLTIRFRGHTMNHYGWFKGVQIHFDNKLVQIH